MSSIDEIDVFQHGLFEAADTLRGSVSAIEYANYVLPLVFLKYISDLNRKHNIEYWENKGRNDAVWLWSRFARMFPKSKKECLDYYYLYSVRQQPDLGKIINGVLRNIENSCPEEFEGVFSVTDYDSNRLGSAPNRSIILGNLLDAVYKISFSKISWNEDIYKSGDLFSIAIEAFASQRKGELRVPSIEVSRLVAKLLAPTVNSRIYDPSCGTGSLLISCATECATSDPSVFRIVGLERNGASWSLARMSAFVHAENAHAIKTGFALGRSGRGESIDFFDIATSFPPWGLKDDLYPRLPLEICDRFLPSSTSKLSSEYATILHMLSGLNSERGRLGVLLPTGSLSKAGTERFVRQRLIEENHVDAVINLPEKIIPGTSIRISLIILLMKRPTRDVLFIDATKSLKATGGRSRLTLEQLHEIVELYRSRETRNEYTLHASFDQIAENDFNLNFINYSDSASFTPIEDIKNLRIQRNSISENLREVNDEIIAQLQKIGFL